LLDAGWGDTAAILLLSEVLEIDTLLWVAPDQRIKPDQADKGYAYSQVPEIQAAQREGFCWVPQAVFEVLALTFHCA
jgi:hypothetical protein